MESKKVKVKLVVGYKQYRVIEVEESEVEKIREVNRMTWRELKQEMRKKESMVKANIVVDSIEDIEEEFESIPDPNAVNPIDEMIEAEEKQEKYAPLYQAIAQLTERQQEMVRMVYFEGMSQDEVAKHFGITKAGRLLGGRPAVWLMQKDGSELIPGERLRVPSGSGALPVPGGGWCG